MLQQVISGEFLRNICQYEDVMPRLPKAVVDLFWKNVRKTDKCWLWEGRTVRGGYGTLAVDGFVSLAHRVSWQLHSGDIPGGLFVCHRCDNPPCCNPDHLFLGTPLDNNRDMAAKGRRAIRLGSKAPLAKLTEWDVQEILKIGSTKSHEELAEQFGVSTKTIGNVLKRRFWKQVACPPGVVLQEPGKAHGNTHYLAKLSDDDVKEILRLRDTMSLTELAKRFKVAAGTIQPILKGKTWKHISRLN